MLQKVFPSGGRSPAHAFNVVLLAEGFLGSESAAFHAACLDFIERALAVPPFNQTRANPGWLNVYKVFLPSANAGPASGTAAAGRTVFESSLDAAAGRLTVSAARVAAVLDAEQVEVGSSSIPFSEYVGKGSRFAAGRVLLVVLLPSHGTSSGGEYEHEAPAVTEYYFVATTQNGQWHQIVLRAMAAQLGLADEFERPGAQWLEPTTRQEKAAPSMNVIHLSSVPLLNRDVRGWSSLISPALQNAPPAVHPHGGAPATPDNTLTARPTTPDSVELWEGGGGFRTKMYRSAQDCLMRRRIGDSALPVRASPVPFCRVCRKVLQDVVA